MTPGPALQPVEDSCQLLRVPVCVRCLGKARQGKQSTRGRLRNFDTAKSQIRN
jgi:hypothetical protein